ncbi:MAG: RDD family protein [Acidobacteriota bacterium]
MSTSADEPTPLEGEKNDPPDGGPGRALSPDPLQRGRAHDPDAAVLGLDNVALDLPIAGVGSRFLALVVDQMALAVLLLLFVLSTVSLGALFDGQAGWVMAVLAFGTFSLQWGYFSVCEILMDGRTPGKSAVGLRTVSHLGGLPSKGAFIARNFLRSFDFLVGLPIMVLDRQDRRLGDLVASTLVVHDRHPPSLQLGRMPPSWTAREIVVAESLLRRASSLDVDVAMELSAQLLGWLEEREPEWLASLGGEAQAGPVGDDSLSRLQRVLQPRWNLG